MKSEEKLKTLKDLTYCGKTMKAARIHGIRGRPGSVFCCEACATAYRDRRLREACGEGWNSYRMPRKGHCGYINERISEKD